MRILPALFVCLWLFPAAGSAQESQHTLIMSGTGFFVNNEYIVTNAHVVKGCASVVIHGAVPAQKASVEMLDTEHDLALIKTSNTAHKVAPMRFDIDSLQAGDKLFILGYPGLEGAQGKYSFVEAQVPALPPGISPPPGRFFISDDLRHGNSGGPIFDEYGNVIGIAVAKTAFQLVNKKTGETIAQEGLGIVISLNTVKDFLSAQGVYTEWVGSGSRSVDPYIEEDSRQFIVNILCRTDEPPPK